MIAYRLGLLGAAVTLAIGCTAQIDAVSGPDGEGGGTTGSVGVGVGGNGTSSIASSGVTGSSSGVGVGGAPGTSGSVGAGGMGGFMTSSSVSGVGGGPACSTPPPVGSLSNCGGAVSSSSGGGSTCTTFTCDDDGNTWDASCGDAGCTCSYNGMPVCSCNFNPGEDSCSGMGCCPPPWVNP
jgi:hypothetical protein